jgi:hypothetical protein
VRVRPVGANLHLNPHPLCPKPVDYLKTEPELPSLFGSIGFFFKKLISSNSS